MELSIIIVSVFVLIILYSFYIEFKKQKMIKEEGWSKSELIKSVREQDLFSNWFDKNVVKLHGKKFLEELKKLHKETGLYGKNIVK